MKLGLGTAQFGLPYGVINTDGQVSRAETMRILSYAQEAGIDLLDTAAAYGNSEEMLGVCLTECCAETAFRIISKTVPLHCSTIGKLELYNVEQRLSSSLRDLCQPNIYGILVHHADDLLVPGGEELYAMLQQWKTEGKASKIGVSVYTGAQIEAILERYSIDLIQIPFNVFDQRLLANGLLGELKRRGIEIHARSVFLQGVLLVDLAHIPHKLASLRPALERFDAAVRECGLSRLVATLGFVQSIPEIDYAIVGTLSANQLKSICAAKVLTTQADIAAIDYTTLRVDDEQLINPALWK